ncbi:MAG: TonB-dependent receptor [Bacteroidales bacterium]|jgi:TonB-linked SusC/RagA family outer membrane protein|nr:TonB-dependent receptor [Bacteroidales bacterium]MDI9552189.1 TonB-dependent receptor [Bacteroidota bacterium]
MFKKGVLIVLLLLANLSLMAQQTVTGTVRDSEGQPMSGVTIIVQGTTVGTLSGVDGRYSLPVPAGATTLRFSFIGFGDQEVAIAGRSVIDVTLEESLTGLDEVVVVGYGTQKKKLVTGSTVQVKGDDIQKLSTVSPMTALQGQTPGLSIIKNTGQPGDGFKVNIRGMGTIGNSQPLYVIDGVPGGNIDNMSPADIESIDVLKDAASAAIYGARGANGVILVTTKQGSRSTSGVKANISYDGSYGLQNLYRKLPLMNAMEYANIIDEARVNSGQPRLDFESLVPDWGRIVSGAWEGTDWLDELSNKNAPVVNNALNITGGSAAGAYSLGLSHSSQEGIFGRPVQSDYERYSFRLNSDFILLRDKTDSFTILKAGETLRYTNSNNHGVGVSNQYSNDVFSCIVASPFLPLYAVDESDKAYPYHYAIPWNPQDSNPIAQMVNSRGHNESKNHNLNASVFLEVQPIRNLVFRSSFGYAMSAGSYRSYTPLYELSATSFNSTDDVSHSLSAGFQWSWENTLNYNFNLGSDHAFNALIGTSAEKWGLGESINGSNSNSLFSDLRHAYLNNTPVIDVNLTSVGSSPWGDGGILSYFGRVGYTFRDKYMLTGILRADASSNFARGKRWGYFPSVSAGWVISEENFFQGASNAINFLKLRASWGQNGNQAISPFQYLATISFANVNYFFGPDKAVVSTGGYPDVLPNPDVTWETSEQINLGFDARLLRNRLSLEFDLYSRTTYDWLIRPSMLASYGTGAPYVNGGDVSNKGFELALNYNGGKREFSYSAGFNLAYNKNEVKKIANNEGIFHGPGNVLGQGTEELYRAQVGFPIGYFWGYKTLGVFQNAADIENHTNSQGKLIQPTAEAGDLIFDDTNDDGVINYLDKVMIGDPNPDFIIGFNFSAAWKGFDFSVLANGAFGHQIARSWRRWADSPQNNYTTDIFNRWHGEGSSNKYPRLTYGSHINWQYVSDIFIEDADYLKLSNVTLGYDFKRIFKAMPLTQARFFVAFQNLYTFTNYIGMDPEIGGGSGTDSWAKGIDIGYYPAPRTVMFGASLKF